MKKVPLLLCFCAGLFLTSCEKETFDVPEEEMTAVDSDAEFVPKEVLVKLKSGGKSNLTNVLARIEAKIVETISTDAMKTEALKRGMGSNEILLISSKLGTLEAIKLLEEMPEVEYAEPNFIYRHHATSDDTYYTDGSLWGMYGDATSPSNQYGSQAGEAWAAGNTGSATVYIGIIDEGYMHEHEDLQVNAGTNPGEIPDNGVDDDENGYVDDVYGWDFDGGDNTVFDGDQDDHGTHVAGTIGGVGGNGLGVAGVAWDVKMMNAKFLGRFGGSTANAIKAVDYFTDLKQRHGINLVATSNSWGGGGFSQGLYEAIERARLADILFIAAAGNDSNDNDSSASYPASYDLENIIAVAAMDSNGDLSSFSNFGATTVDMGAPGRGIYSTVPLKSRGKVVSGYKAYSGTSMATPHVSGGAVLYAASNPGASASEIKAALMNSSVPTSSLTGKCVSGGRLNVSGF